MKKIKTKSLKENLGCSLTREQLKYVVGGSGANDCIGKNPGDVCNWNGKNGVCKYLPFSGLVCWCG